MSRPSASQLCLGSFTVVAATVALLAVSGASGVLEVAVLVALALALGTLVAVLPLRAAEPSRPAAAGRGREYARQR